MVLTDEQKKILINKYKLGSTIKTISDDMNITQSTVHKWIKRYKMDNDISRKRGSGIRIIDNSEIKK